METSLDIKFEKLCRVCLCDSDKLKSLRAKLSDEDKTVLEAIQYVVNIEIKIEDGLPDKICTDCETILDLADIFKRRCLDSEEILGQQHPTTEKQEILDLPVTFDKVPEISSANASLKDVVDNLIKKESNLAIYANVTISKHKSKKKPTLDPDVIEIHDNDEKGLKVDLEISPDDYENVEFLDEIEICDDIETTSIYPSVENGPPGPKIFPEVTTATCADPETTCLETKETECKNAKETNVQKPKGIKGKRVLTKKKKKAAPKRKILTCDHCGKTYDRVDSMRAHMSRIHNPKLSGDFPCGICDIKFNQKHKLTSHLKKKHIPAVIQYKYPCKKCSRQFKYKSGLKKHMGLWHGNYYHCRECKLKFTKRDALEEHKKERHDKGKTQLCTFCGRLVASSSHLDHILRHQNIRDRKCDKCEKSFVSRAELRIHSVTHTGDRRFLCPVCGRGFSTSSAQKKHLSHHSDERPFSCEYCSKTFKEVGVLRKHLRIHTGEKPHQCPVCETAFTRRDHLGQHLRRHARDTPNIDEVIAKNRKNPGRPRSLAMELELKEFAPYVKTAAKTDQ